MINGVVTYKDIDFSFMKNPATGDLRVKKNENAIKQSLLNIISTKFRERTGLRPNFGTEIGLSLFEQMDSSTSSDLEDQISLAIENYEPRVSIENLEVVAIPEKNDISITLFYTIENFQEPQTINTLLSKLR